MSIFHNGKEYGATKVINYSASPDYNRGVAVTNIQDGNYQATDNGFLLIELQSQQSNVTKVSVIRSQNPITDNTGTEIASIVLSQYQYSETLIAQVMARDYYKLIIEGVGNPQVLSCMFYPYASTVPIKLTENITMEQVEGLGELAVVDNVDLATQTTGVLPIGKGGTGTTNATEAYTALGGKALGKMDSIALTDDKLTGVLPVNKGGTGRYDGFGFRNGYHADEFWNLLGLSIPCTTQEFCDAFRNYCDNPVNGIPKPVSILNIATIHTILLSDLPPEINSVNGHQLQIKYSDFNQIEMQLVAPYGNYSLYGGGISAGIFRGWKKLRNNDGSIPAELINLPIGFIYIQLRDQSTPDKLFGSSGKWQDISATYAGEFFRAVGGNSAAFGSKQNEGLPNITANWGETYLRQNHNIQPSGAATGTVGLAQAFGNSTVSSINSIGFNASYANTIYGSSTHVTPYNSAIRIWKKIS